MPQQPPQMHYPPQNYAPPAVVKEKNTVGLFSLILAVVGFVFACIPGALILGWILLPIAFILSIVSFFLKDKKRGLGVAGLVISIVGTIVGFMVFLVVIGDSIDEAFSGNSPTVNSSPASSDDADSEGVVDEGIEGETEEPSTPVEGTRANPYPIGAVLETNDWQVVVNEVNLDASKEIAAESRVNDPAPEGQVYLMANLTITYIGDDADGSSPWTNIEYVTAEGNTVSSTDTFVMEPDSLDRHKTLYEGASTSGNIAFTVPADTAGDGVLAIRLEMFGDKVYVAVK
jgi:hypothetical protein